MQPYLDWQNAYRPLTNEELQKLQELAEKIQFREIKDWEDRGIITTFQKITGAVLRDRIESEK